MPDSHGSTNITQRIQHLLDTRHQHAQAIAAIDDTLAKVGAALGGNGTAHKPATSAVKHPAPAKAVVAKPAAAKPVAKAMAKPVGKTVASKPAASGTRTRRQFAVSGEQSILTFVKSKSNPKGNEIETHWKSEGRKGRAINLISKLAKEKKLKRIPLKGERGSRYSIA